MTIEQNAQVSNWGADGAEALPKAPPLPIDGVELKHCPCYIVLMPNSILSAYQFSLLMGTLLFLEAISLYGENTFTSVENQCLLIEKTLTFVQTTAMG